MRCDWTATYRTVLKDLGALPPGEDSRMYSLDELFARSGGDRESAVFRRRSFWASAKGGDLYWPGARFALIVVSFAPDELCLPVERVTIRLRPEWRK